MDPKFAKKMRQISGEKGTANERFTVLQWNVLAEIYGIKDSFPNVPKATLAWEYRGPQILNYIIASQADFVCLEEMQQVDYEDYFQPELEKVHDQCYRCKTSLKLFLGRLLWNISEEKSHKAKRCVHFLQWEQVRVSESRFCSTGKRRTWPK